MSILMPEPQDVEFLKNKFQEALGEEYIVETHKELSNSFWRLSTKKLFDIVVYKGDRPVLAAEYKSFLFQLQISFQRDYYIEKFNNIGIKFGVIYYGEDENCLLYQKESFDIKKCSFNDIVEIVTSKHNTNTKKPTINNVIDEILKTNDRNKSCLSDNQIEEIKKLFTEERVSFNDNKRTISLDTKSEDAFFKILLPKLSKNKIYRYTSLNSLFCVIKDKTIGMCSITCMNDKGELQYSDSFINHGLFSASENMQEQDNNCFVLSCCDSERGDNLTMWRLYANNGKGVCIEYEIDNGKIDDETFFLSPVSYGQSQNRHDELELLKLLSDWEKNGWRFDFRRWHIWKHFFKSHNFADEHEIRLLFIPQKDKEADINWILDSTNNIASRICRFNVNDMSFPLKHIQALIGPKCPEQICNVDQFNYMNSIQKVFEKPTEGKAIKPSTITDYR